MVWYLATVQNIQDYPFHAVLLQVLLLPALWQNQGNLLGCRIKRGDRNFFYIESLITQVLLNLKPLEQVRSPCSKILARVFLDPGALSPVQPLHTVSVNLTFHVSLHLTLQYGNPKARLVDNPLP